MLGVKINPYLLLFLAALPDIDLLLAAFGIQHRTWTHSILVWSLIFAPFFIVYRKRTIPYFLAPIQHIIFGDAITGAWNRPLFPLSHFNFSLGYGLFSVENIALETAGLGIFLLFVLATRTARASLFNYARQKIVSFTPLVLLLGFVLFIFSYSWAADVLLNLHILRESRLLDSVPTAVQHPLFPFAMALHLVLMGVISVSILIGSKARKVTLIGQS